MELGHSSIDTINMSIAKRRRIEAGLLFQKYDAEQDKLLGKK